MEYRFTDAYNVEDISLANMQKVAEKLKEDPLLMQKYIYFNSVSYSFEKCDEICQNNHLCAINFLDKERYENCTISVPKTISVSGCNATCRVLIAVGILIFLALFITLLFLNKRLNSGTADKANVPVDNESQGPRGMKRQGSAPF